MNNKKIILGLVGELAAGKGTVVKYLTEKHQAVSVRFSDQLRDTLNQYDVEISRENMQNLSTALRQNFGENVLARAVAKKVKLAQENLIIIDGVRRLTDIENLTNLPGFKLIYVTADPKIRYDRQTTRNENAGDSSMSFEEFKEREKAEADQRIPETAKASDFKIDNSGTLDELYRQVEKIISSL